MKAAWPQHIFMNWLTFEFLNRRMASKTGVLALFCVFVLALLGVAPSPAQASPYTEGLKQVLFIRVDFSDKVGEPLTAAAAQALIDTTVSPAFVENSYGKTSLQATVTPTLRMPQTAAYYSTKDQYGNDQAGQLLVDARAASATAGFNTNNYDLDICAFATIFDFGGLGYVGAKGTWLNGYFDFRVTAHELGHNLGLWHANTWKTSDGSIIGAGVNEEYTDNFDIMGANFANTQEAHFNAWFKNRLDWLPNTGVQNVTASGTYRINAQDIQTATGLRALKIVKDSSKNYWVEYRSKFPTNAALQNGALLHWGFNYNDGSQLLDTTPNSSTNGDANVNDAPLQIGKTLSDTAAGVHITPIGKGVTSTLPWLDVVVNMGTFTGNGAPTVSISPQNPSILTGGSINFSATATDPNGDTLSYFWEFGDGTTASTATFSKSWAANGTYTVKCTVSDRKGGATTATTTATVGPRAITLVAPADNTAVTGTTTLRATSNDNANTTQVNFERQNLQASFTRNPNLAIPDVTTVSDSATVSASGNVSTATVTVNITHSYVGDLTLTLVAPDNSTKILRQNTGGNTQNIQESYDVSTAMAGKAISGTWTLRINDNYNADSGVLNSWSMAFASPWTTIGSDTNGPDGNGEWTASWNTTATPDGNYQVRAVGVGASGSVSDTNTNIAVSNSVVAPTISGFNPTLGPVGTQVTISGTNLSGASAVSFNGTSAGALGTGFFVDSATQIRAFVPTGATTGAISVTTSGGTATTSALSPGVFTVLSGNSISGRVTTDVGAALSGVTVTRTGATTTTDAQGYYGFANLTASSGGTSYTIKATKTSYTFAPASLALKLKTSAPTISNANFVALQTKSVSGRVTDELGAGLPGVVLTRSGGGGADVSVTSNSGGYFGFSSVAGSSAGISYTVTPAKSGYTFAPTSATALVKTSNVSNLLFVGLANTSITGRITNASGAAMSGVTVKRNGQSPGVLTNSLGYYGFSNVPSGSHTLVASKSGLTFSPASQSATISGANVTGANFEALFSLAGKVTTDVGVGVGSVAISVSSSYGPLNTTTDSNGNFSVSGLRSGTYSVTPSAPNTVFNPVSLSATISTSVVTNLQFVALTGNALSGRVTTTGGSGISGVSITRTGNGTPVLSNAGGYYGFSNVANGTYTLTPGKTNLSFNPTSRSATINGASVAALDFTGLTVSSTTGSLSGRVTDANGAGIAGVSVLRSGSTSKATTNAGGYYGFSSVPASSAGVSYTVTPSKTGYSFNPVSQNAVVKTTQNATDVNFVAQEGSISGRITDSNGNGVSGVSVGRSGTSTKATSDANGNFRFALVPASASSYTITPTKTGLTFNPTSQTATVTATQNAAGVDFVALSSFSISGRVTTSAGVGVAGVSLTRTGSATPVVTNSLGYYGFSSVPSGSYSVAASKAGFSFSTTTAMPFNLSASKTGVNFTATPTSPSPPPIGSQRVF